MIAHARSSVQTKARGTHDAPRTRAITVVVVG